MKIKQKPEDFSVKESFRYDPVEGGRFRVYLMDKQKLSTFDAVEKLRVRFGLRPASISYCGLKDKQGRTEQLIAVDGADIDMQEPNLRLKYMGRTDRALSAANTTSNRFSVTVRSLEQSDFPKLEASASEVSRLGVVNYFDSQRFGALKHGQGFIAKDLMRGDFEAALRNYMAKPSPLDRTEDAKVKKFWKENWRQWDAYCPYKSNSKYSRILKVLKDKPDDFVNAFLQIDSSYRAMILFEYQSFLWNEGARRYLQLKFSRDDLFPMPYQAGTVLFHRRVDPAEFRTLGRMMFPLLSPKTDLNDLDPVVRQAVEWVLGKEKLTLASLEIPDAKGKLFFKHEDRPLLVFPEKLVLGRQTRDELNPGMNKLNVAFTLPPGSYATLVIKRLFHFSYREETREEIAPREYFSENGETVVDERPSTPSASAPRRDGSVSPEGRRDWSGARPASVRGPRPATPGGSRGPRSAATGDARATRPGRGDVRGSRGGSAAGDRSRDPAGERFDSRRSSAARPERSTGERSEPRERPVSEVKQPARMPTSGQNKKKDEGFSPAPDAPVGFRAAQKAKKVHKAETREKQAAKKAANKASKRPESRKKSRK